MRCKTYYAPFKRRILSGLLFLIVASGVFCGFLFPGSVIGFSAVSPDSYAGIVTTQSSNLNVRAASAANSSVISSLAKGTYVTVAGKNGGMYKVEYADNTYGYSASSYITPVPGSYTAYVRTSGGNLNVRSGAGTSYGIISSLPNGKAVVILGESGGWYRILYAGVKTGYVSKSYISSSPSSASGNQSYTSVYLSLPSYKQLDSRWRYDYVGYSGYTIGQIGCTTTCLAMTESYRRGYSVYPDAMEDSLSYTSGGALYWPSNYTLYYGSDYLETAYSLLKSGRPVIIGSKNANGGTHWVVITGFKGGELRSENFVINDPGTSLSSSLAVYQSNFPYYMKLAYYNS